MKKRNSVICIVSLLTILLAVSIILIPKEEEKPNQNAASSNTEMEVEQTEGSLVQIKSWFSSDIQKLKEGTYANLIATDFTASIEDVEGIYHLEILSDTSYKEKTHQEQVDLMKASIDKFFQGEFDNSYLQVDIMEEGSELVRDIAYEELAQLFAEMEEDTYELGYLWGTMEDSEKPYFAQICPFWMNTWFSKGTFGTTLPCDRGKEYPYVTGIRQEDPTITLTDGEFLLSQLEENMYEYLLGEDFPLPITEDITYGIGTVSVAEYENGSAVSFILRRIYKGVPFEYGWHSASGEFIDSVGHDYATLSYANSTSLDTLMGFKGFSGSIVETKEITQMITAGKAIEILSEKIGENSTYDVYGVELIYRNCEIPEERQMEVRDILEPKWKILAKNQNDNKYTLFYIDVVTGEITERFEYYYE